MSDMKCPECGKPMFAEADGWWFCANNHRAIYLGREQAGAEADIQKASVATAETNRPAPVCCVPTCPVRREAELVTRAGMSPAALDAIRLQPLMDALAAPCLTPPAADFDRAEFDVLLKEVVALPWPPEPSVPPAGSHYPIPDDEGAL